MRALPAAALAAVLLCVTGARGAEVPSLAIESMSVPRGGETFSVRVFSTSAEDCLDPFAIGIGWDPAMVDLDQVVWFGGSASTLSVNLKPGGEPVAGIYPGASCDICPSIPDSASQKIITLKFRKLYSGDERISTPIRFVDPPPQGDFGGGPTAFLHEGAWVPAATRDGTVTFAGIGFVRGDMNDDGVLNLTDPIAILRPIFFFIDDYPCRDAGDVDDSGMLDITDAIALLQHLFMGGMPPRAPYPACGNDPTPDDMYTVCDYTQC
jgi:hypothetical protein